MAQLESVSPGRTGALAWNKSAFGLLALLWLNLPVSWLTLLFIIGWFLPLLGCGYWLYRALQAQRRREPGRAWYWLLAPYTVLPVGFAIAAVSGYATGRATLQQMWFPADPLYLIEMENLDPDLRCYPGGGFPFPDYFYTAALHNVVLRGMCHLFGPVPGHYHGDYPSAGEAGLTIDRLGQEVTAQQVAAGQVEFDGQLVPLPELEHQLKLARGEVMLNVYQWASNGQSLLLAPFRDQCWIVQYQNNPKYSPVLALIDPATREVFARYERWRSDTLPLQ